MNTINPNSTSDQLFKNSLNSNFTNDQIYKMISGVVGQVDAIYKQSHTKPQYLTYKIGKKTASVFKFIRSPQMKVFNMIVFWAMFVASWIITAVTYGTIPAFIIFGLIIAVYTDITATAVSAIIQTTMVNYYSGLIKNA